MRNLKLANDTLKPWKFRRPGAATVEERLAEMLAELAERMEREWSAYYRRLESLLGHEKYCVLYAYWCGNAPEPPEGVDAAESDEQALKHLYAAAQLEYLLNAAKQNSVVSEHYFYSQTGRVRLPKDWLDADN